MDMAYSPEPLTCVNCWLNPTTAHFGALENPHILSTLDSAFNNKPMNVDFILDTLEMASTTRHLLLDLRHRLDTLLDVADRILDYRPVLPPIHHLPSSVLTTIFEHVQDDNTYFGPPLSLQLVCTRWTTILHASPSLWTNVHIMDASKVHAERSTHALEKQLTLSRDLPIQVTSLGVLERAVPEHVSLLAQHRDRWRSITLSTSTSLASDFFVPSQSAYQLTRVSLVTQGEGTQELGISSAHELTQISLRMDDVYVPLHFPWSSIHRMKFRGSFVAGNPLTFLPSLIAIEDLDFSWTFKQSLLESSEPYPYDEPRKISWPNLKSLVLEMTSNHATPVLFDLAQSLLAQTLPLISAPSIQDLSIGFLDEPCLDALNRMLISSSSFTLKSLYVCSRQAKRLDALLPVLAHLSHLESLRFESRVGEWLDIQALLEGMLNNDGFLPSLHTLRIITASCRPQTLKDLVARRSSLKLTIRLHKGNADEWLRFTRGYKDVRITIEED